MHQTAGPSGDPLIGSAKTASLVGGQMTPVEPSPVFSECVSGQSCSKMAEDNNSIGCPSSYWTYGDCFSRSCVHHCTSSATGGMCETDWWGSCTDTTLSSSPGLCGQGEKGHCNYTTVHFDGLWIVQCISQGLCYPGDGRIQCGVIRTCS